MNLLSLTAVELGKKIKAHEVTVEEATRTALDAIRAKEKDINSFVTVDGKSLRMICWKRSTENDLMTGHLPGLGRCSSCSSIDNMCTKGNFKSTLQF